MLAERKQFSLEEVETFSRQICALFFEHFTPVSPQVIPVFLPILKNRELNTWPIIHKLWQEFPECRTVVPVTNFQTQELEHYQITPETTIEVNHWGIPEPVNALRVFEAEIDTVFHSQQSTFDHNKLHFHSSFLCSFCLDAKRTKKVKSKRNSLTAQTSL